MKQCTTCMEYQQIQSCEKIIPYKLLYKPLEVVGADIFTMNNTLLCNGDYYSKIPVVKKTDSLLAHNVLRAFEICLQNLGFQKVLNAGTNFISDKFVQFCRQLYNEQAIISSTHNQSNGQVEPSTKFVKCTIKKCLDNKDDIGLALLRSTPIGEGLAIPVTLSIYRSISAPLPQMNRELISWQWALCIHKSMPRWIHWGQWYSQRPIFIPYKVYSICVAQGWWTTGTWHSGGDEWHWSSEVTLYHQSDKDW